jgi:hypothetical protein
MIDPVTSVRARGVLVVLSLIVAVLLGYAVHQHYQVTSIIRSPVWAPKST